VVLPNPSVSWWDTQLSAKRAVESFFVNVRLLAEFLAKDMDNRGYHARDFVPEWTKPSGDAADRLLGTWKLDREHVSTEQVPARPSQ
jgi:hypothetical protein